MNIEIYKDSNAHIRADSDLSESTLNAMLKEEQKRSRKQKHRSVRRSFAIPTIAVILAAGCVAVSAQTGIFSLLAGNKDTVDKIGSKYFELGNNANEYNYEALSKNSDAIASDDKDAVVSLKKVQIQAETYYFDGEILFLTLKAENKNKKIKNQDFIGLKGLTAKINGVEIPCNQLTQYISLIRSATPGEENIYTGTAVIRVPDSKILSERNRVILTFEEAAVRVATVTEKNCSVIKTALGSGELSFDIKRTAPAPVTYAIGAEQDGFRIETVTLSAFGLKIDSAVPEKYGDSNKETIEITDNDGSTNTIPKYSIITACYDQSGKQLSGSETYYRDETDGSLWMLYDNGQPSEHITEMLIAPPDGIFTMKFLNKQNDLAVMAEFRIDLSDYTPMTDTSRLVHTYRTDKENNGFQLFGVGTAGQDFAVHFAFPNDFALGEAIRNGTPIVYAEDVLQCKEAEPTVVEFYDANGKRLDTLYQSITGDYSFSGDLTATTGIAKCRLTDTDSLTVKFVYNSRVLAEISISLAKYHQ